MTRTAIVFGSNGFLGKWIVAALLEAGWRCIGVDRNGRTTESNVGVSGRYYTGSDWSPDLLSDFLSSCGRAAVVNVGGAPWSTDPDVLLRDNIVWPFRLATACRTAGSIISILHIGSSHEYADMEYGTSISESSRLGAITSYGKSKTCGASYLVRAAMQMEIPMTIVRPFNVIGPGHGSNGLWAVLVGRYQSAMTARVDQVTVPAPLLHTKRDWIDVRDVALLVSAAMSQERPVLSTYNAASGVATSIKELLDAFTEHTGVAYELSSDPVPMRTGPRWQRADMARAKSVLHWRRQFNLADSIRACLEGRDTVTLHSGNPVAGSCFPD